MRRARSNWSRPPQPSYRRSTRHDNLTIVPASELVSLQKWQKRARQLPPGNTLLVLPSDNLHIYRVGHRIKRTLELQGRHSSIATVTRRRVPDITS